MSKVKFGKRSKVKNLVYVDSPYNVKVIKFYEKRGKAIWKSKFISQRKNVQSVRR